MSGGSETSTATDQAAATTITVKTPMDWGRLAGSLLGGAANAVGSIMKGNADKDAALQVAGLQYNKSPQQQALASQLMTKFGGAQPNGAGPTASPAAPQPQSIDDLRRRFMAIGGQIPGAAPQPQMARRV